MVISGLSENFEALRRHSFTRWASSGRLQYRLRNERFGAAGDVALAALVDDAAWDAARAIVVAPSQTDVMQGLTELEAAGFTARTEAGRWYLTDAARATLEFGQVLCEPMSCCLARSQSETLPIADLTSFEVILALEGCGWEWQPLPPRRIRLAVAIMDLKCPGEIQHVWYGGYSDAYARVMLSIARVPDKLIHQGFQTLHRAKSCTHPNV
jgi:hypothetical protein